jgi:hypothetical protein
MAGVQVEIIFHSTALAWAMAVPAAKAHRTMRTTEMDTNFFI